MAVDLLAMFAERVPAAVMFRGLLARVFADERLDQIFREHKRRQLEGPLLFSALVRLLVPVVEGGKRTVHASFQASETDLGVSVQAVYDKLHGVEPAVSAALVTVPVGELAELLARAKTARPDVIPGYHTFVIDGKRLDGTEHRLPETRRMKSAPLPGTALAVLDTRWELFTDVVCHPDAYACERKVVEPILARLEEGALYLADRNFCDGPLIARFLARKACFILREHGRSPRRRELGRPRKIGVDARGNAVLEQRVEVYLPETDEWRELRRVIVRLQTATRDGDRELHLLTNLPAKVSALVISVAYGGRWTIETCLGRVAQALNAEINTLAYPGAALLCFCLGLTLFNLLSALEALLRKFAPAPAGSDAQTDAAKLSTYYLAMEIAEARLGLEVIVPAASWEAVARLPLAAFLAWLRSVARHAVLRRYRKHPRGPKRPPPKRSSGKRRAHVSTHRILIARTQA